MKLKLGARRSKLALMQAELASDILRSYNTEIQIEILPIQTSGDKDTSRPLYEIGGKALFVKELEEALLSKQIDVAVHSLKDVPAEVHTGLEICGYIKRGRAEDVLVYTDGIDLDGALLVGTSSPRRMALIKSMWPHYRICNIRGNVDTRLRKIYQQKEMDSAILALAGLERLNALSNIHYKILDPDVFVPAVGQGTICLEIRSTDYELKKLLQTITDKQTKIASEIERAFLKEVSGDCKTPLGAYARNINDNTIKLSMFLANADYTKTYTNSITCSASDGKQHALSFAKQAKSIVGT